MNNQWDTETSLLLELPRIQASLESYYRLIPEEFAPPYPGKPLVFNDAGQYSHVEHIIDFFTDEWSFTDQSPAVWFEDEVSQIDFDRTVYQLVYLSQSEPFIVAALGLFIPILQSKFLAQKDEAFQKRMLWTFTDSVPAILTWEDDDLNQTDQSGIYDWRDNRNTFSLERITEYLQFAGLPPLEDPNVPPAWVFRDLCSHSVSERFTDEELKAELHMLYAEQEREKQLFSTLSTDYTQPNLFGWEPAVDRPEAHAEQLNLLDPKTQPAVSEADVHDLDQLFQRSAEYRQSANYLELLNFISQQKKYAPYNAFLMHTQHPRMTHAETAEDWKEKYDRDIRPNARPLVILIPFGPVNFVYDIEDTVGPPLPVDLTEPFRASGELSPRHYDVLHANCARLDVVIKREDLQNNLAGNICREDSGYTVKLNKAHKKEVQFATLVHELAHMLCGHLGARPKKDKWQDRRKLSRMQQELEAESVSYLVCKRLGITSEAEAYLSNYVSDNVTIEEMSLHNVLTVAGKIISMCDRLIAKKSN